jgi:transposase
LLDETEKPGESVSTVARRYRLSPSMLLAWRKAMAAGAATGMQAQEPLVPASDVKQLKSQIRELERVLWRKIRENEILKEAFEIIGEKNLSRPNSCRNREVFGKGIVRALGVSRPNLLEQRRKRQRPHLHVGRGAHRWSGNRVRHVHHATVLTGE